MDDGGHNGNKVKLPRANPVALLRFASFCLELKLKLKLV
jgi:hypothetical protein